MKNIKLVIPKKNEYFYKEKLESDAKTMSYNAGYEVTYNGYNYNTGCIKFNKDNWNSLLNNDKKYFAYIKDLLVELEQYILSIDEDELDQLHPEYRDKMALIDLEEVNENNGKCFLTIEDEKVIGLIMGAVRKYDEYDYLDYKCPKCGVVTELVVSKNVRGKGIGKKLMQVMEEYFKSIGCEYISIEVFAYNKNAIKFYESEGYHTRGLIDIKKI